MLYWDNEKTIPSLVSILKQDEVILASGDTVLGLWGHTTEAVYEKLNDIKHRKNKPYLLVMGSKEKLSLFTDQVFTEQIKTLIENYWPGPMTLIFKARPDLPSWLKSPDGTIAIRIPNHAGILELLKHFDALFSTSANINNQPIPDSVSLVDSSIINKVGATCVQEEEKVNFQPPSTIINVSSGSIEIVRKGLLDDRILKELTN